MQVPADSAPADQAPRRMLAGGAFATAAARLLGLASLGIASIVIGRALGPGGYGTFAVAFSLQWFILATASVGLANGIGYEVATGRWLPGSAIRHGVVASIALGVLGAAAGAVLLAVAGDDLLPGVSTAAIAIFLAGIPLGLALVILVGIAVALERYEAAAVMLAGQSIVIALLAGTASLPFDLSATVAAIGIGLFATGLLSVIWALRLASTAHPHGESSAPPDPPRFRESIRFGAKTWTADLINLINLRVDLILVAALASASQAGLYAVAATIVSLGVVVPEAFAQVLLPRIGALDQEGGPASAEGTVQAAGRHSVITAAGTSMALIVGVLLIPVFYGAKFDDSVVLGLILIPGVAAFGISRVLGYVLAGLGAPDVVWRLSAVVVAPTLLAFVLVIPSAEATGAAIVSTVSYGATLLVMLIALRRRSGLSSASLLIPRKSDLSAYQAILAAIRPYVRSRRDGASAPHE